MLHKRVEEKDMKIVYVIFTVLLWCAIPIFGLFSLLGFIFFILGLLIVLKGRNKALKQHKNPPLF
jgi:hypothetical protein